MGDFSLKITADKLGKSLENLAPALEEEINSAVANLAQAAYANIVANAQSKITKDSMRKDYLSGLKFETLGDGSYLIYLDGKWPNEIEDGVAPFDMKQTHLKSQKKVGVGPRAGEPWVRTAKDGHKWAVVPMEHKPMQAKAGDLDAEIKKMVTTNVHGQNQKVTQIFKNLEGNPMSGQVFKADKIDHPDLAKNLQNLVKYQYVHDSGRVTSLYMTYRIMSENSTGWNHPGYPALNFFDEAESYVERELENIVKQLL